MDSPSGGIECYRVTMHCTKNTLLGLYKDGKKDLNKSLSAKKIPRESGDMTMTDFLLI